LTPDVSSEDWHSRQGYGVELVCQGNVVCCPHIGIAQLVECEEADWPSCVHTIRHVMTESLCKIVKIKIIIIIIILMTIIIKRFPAHDELGTCRTSLVSPCVRCMQT